MGDKIVVGPIPKGLQNNVTAFNIDNDSFIKLINAYQWRDRVLRKRGTSLLTRFRRYFDSLNASYGAIATITLDGAGAGNILSGFGLEGTSSLFPGSVTITAGANTYTDIGIPSTGALDPSGSINYATGDILIAAEAGNAVSVTFNYFPSLPVMGIEDNSINNTQFIQTLGFDTRYSYNVVTASPYPAYDVTFYKNPSASALLPGYVPKALSGGFHWNGQDYQQFYTVNYQGAVWASNGIRAPFVIGNIGMQFKPIVTATVLTPTTASLVITGHGLIIGDYVYINEVVGLTGINFQTGYVTAVTDVNTVVVTFPNATLTGGPGTGGIAQYLTSTANPALDGIRFYDGDPTNGNINNPALTGTKGWVNFAPPLSQFNYSIADLPQAQYYLAGARLIVNYKDRLLFIGPVVQRGADGTQVYLQDTIIYSQNGTPYYTTSFTATDILSVANQYNSLLVPVNQTATPSAWFEDSAGFGGFISAGIEEAMTSVSIIQDVLIVGLTTGQARVVYSGNDVLPFNIFLIDSELGTTSTFSSVNLGNTVLSKGSRAYVQTSQTQAERFDLLIPDEVFEINLTKNGNERFTAQRDFINEWIYFSYPNNNLKNKFPNTTLQYNYRDNTWGMFFESYTTYGLFRKQTGFTWQTVGNVFPSWQEWNEPWNAGSSTLLQPSVLGGNQQGFLLIRDDGTGEGNSLQIKSFNGNQVTCIQHGLNDNDYIVISGAVGPVGAEVNNRIFRVYDAGFDDMFRLDPAIDGLDYAGLGVIKRMYIPFIQTKQFPSYWGMGRKTTLGPQQYLFTTTPKGKITLYIYLSMDGATPVNAGSIVPSPLSVNNTLIYSSVLRTCPENTNSGLTPYNINLQSPGAKRQDQIWHRKNTSLTGDTVQLAFTMNDEQMRDPDFNNQFVEIELHNFILDVSPGAYLS